MTTPLCVSAPRGLGLECPPTHDTLLRLEFHSGSFVPATLRADEEPSASVSSMPSLCFWDLFEQQSLIGEGASCHVFRGRRLCDGQLVAIKELKKTGPVQKELFANEWRNMLSLNLVSDFALPKFHSRTSKMKETPALSKSRRSTTDVVTGSSKRSVSRSQRVATEMELRLTPSHSQSHSSSVSQSPTRTPLAALSFTKSKTPLSKAMSQKLVKAHQLETKGSAALRKWPIDSVTDMSSTMADGSSANAALLPSLPLSTLKSAISKTHLLPLIGAFEDKNRYYIVTECMEGPTLRRYCSSRASGCVQIRSSTLRKQQRHSSKKAQQRSKFSREHCEEDLSDESDYSGDGDEMTTLLTVSQVRENASLLCQVVDAICSLHSRGWVHRDLKSENFVFRYPMPATALDEDHSHTTVFGSGSVIGGGKKSKQSVKWSDEKSAENNELVLLDFSDCMKIEDMESNDDSISDFVGSVLYMAPECLRMRKVIELFATDMWALGVIAFEILADGSYPFYGPNSLDIIKKVLMAPLQFPRFTLTKAVSMTTTTTTVSSLTPLPSPFAEEKERCLPMSASAASALDRLGTTQSGGSVETDECVEDTSAEWVPAVVSAKGRGKPSDKGLLPALVSPTWPGSPPAFQTKSSMGSESTLSLFSVSSTVPTPIPVSFVADDSRDSIVDTREGVLRVGLSAAGDASPFGMLLDADASARMEVEKMADDQLHDFQQLIEGCLVRGSRDRMTIVECLEHPLYVTYMTSRGVAAAVFAAEEAADAAADAALIGGTPPPVRGALSSLVSPPFLSVAKSSSFGSVESVGGSGSIMRKSSSAASIASMSPFHLTDCCSGSTSRGSDHTPVSASLTTSSLSDCHLDSPTLYMYYQMDRQRLAGEKKHSVSSKSHSMSETEVESSGAMTLESTRKKLSVLKVDVGAVKLRKLSGSGTLAGEYSEDDAVVDSYTDSRYTAIAPKPGSGISDKPMLRLSQSYSPSASDVVDIMRFGYSPHARRYARTPQFRYLEPFRTGASEREFRSGTTVSPLTEALKPLPDLSSALSATVSVDRYKLKRRIRFADDDEVADVGLAEDVFMSFESFDEDAEDSESEEDRDRSMSEVPTFSALQKAKSMLPDESTTLGFAAMGRDSPYRRRLRSSTSEVPFWDTLGATEKLDAFIDKFLAKTKESERFKQRRSQLHKRSQLVKSRSLFLSDILTE